ncbi:MAG: nitroreductase family protein [Deltaproteobacteria bacterium]|nr:nitroreductase family protein [Deltaproteobacteria bacterium]
MITIDESRCNLCGICVPICPRKILHLGERSVEVTDPLMCLACGHCKAICPTDAPRLTGSEPFAAVPTKEEIPSPDPFLRFLRRRRSLRKYQKRPVEKEKWDWIIDAGRYSPTGGNRQICEFTVVNGRKMLDPVCTLAMGYLQAEGQRVQDILDRYRHSKEPLPADMVGKEVYPPVWDRMARAWEKGGDQLLHQAPGLIVVHMKRGVISTPEVEGGIAATHMVLMAETLGLGTCFIGFLIWAIESAEKLKKLLQVPADHQSLVAFTVGYPDVEYLRLPARRPAKVTWLGETSS